MTKIGALAAAALLAAATALAGAAYAKGGGGGGGRGGGGGHGGGHAAHGGGHGGGHAFRGGGHGFRGGGHGGHGFRMGGHRGGGHAFRVGRHGGGHAFRAGRHGGGHGVRAGHRGGMHALHRGGRHHLAAPRGFAPHAPRRARAAALRAHPSPRGAAIGRATRATAGFAAPALPRAFAGRHGHRALAAHLFARPAFRAAVWPGPFFWSYGVDDVFWPTAYDDVFWTYGTGDIVTGILAPNFYARGDRAPRRLARGEPAARAAEDMARLCADMPVDLADLAGIAAAVQPTEEQRALLKELEAAEAKAVDLTKAACPRQPPPTPTERLAAMAQWFSAMREAVRIVRPPLEAFYAALTDEQKARLLSAAGEQRDAASRWLARCRAAPRGMASLPSERVARTLDLDGAQVAALDDLTRASDKAADALAGTCPQEIPLTPTGRIAAIEGRLDALLAALDTLRPPLERFYAALSEAQKARFNSLGARSTGRGRAG
jgi:LTXXQ motif family protein